MIKTSRPKRQRLKPPVRHQQLSLPQIVATYAYSHMLQSLPSDLVHIELERILADPLFSKSKLLQRLLRLLVNCAEQNLPVTESFLARRLLGLDERDFHPYSNSYVRVIASLLRKRLRQYYARESPIGAILHLPVGGFSLRIEPAHTIDSQWKRLLSQARLLADSCYVEELAEAVALLERIISIKPDFAPAFARLATAHLSLAAHGAPSMPHLQSAVQAAARAIEFAPDSWESLTSAASIAGLVNLEWTHATALFERALAIPGNHVAAHPSFHAYMVAIGRLTELLPLMERSLSESEFPLRALQRNYGICLHIASRFNEAESEMQRTAILFPDDYTVWSWLAIQFWMRDSPDKAIDALNRGVLTARDRMPGQLMASIIESLHGRHTCSSSSLDGSIAELPTVVACAFLGDAETAVAAMCRMAVARNPLIFLLLRSPFIGRLSVSPEFPEVFHSLGIPLPRTDSSPTPNIESRD